MFETMKAVLCCVLFATAICPAHAATSTGISPICTVDTRSVPTGTLTGLVEVLGSPISNAQVRIDGTVFAAKTGVDGRFGIAAVPTGSGYLLKVSAAGYAPKSIRNLSVKVGTTDVGNVQLYPLNGPCRILPLQPEVNPAVSSIEEGGVAYRYYLVTAADGTTPATSSSIVVKRSVGNVVIPQDGDISGSLPGRTTGVPDGDGILRLKIPASYIPLLNSSYSFEVYESGALQQTFEVMQLARQYDHVWRHRVGGGVSGKIAVVKVGGSGAYESEVRETVAGTVPISQSITRTRSGKLRAGLEVGGGLKVVGGAAASAGAGISAGVQLESTYGFSPTSSDPGDNLMKLYVALGDELSLAAGPARGIYVLAASAYEAKYLNSSLQSVEGELLLGDYAEADAVLGLKAGKQESIGVSAGLSVEGQAVFGIGENYGPYPQGWLSMGLRASGSANLNAGLGFGQKGDKNNSLQLSLFNAGGTVEETGRVFSDLQTSRVLSFQVQQTVALDHGFDFPLSGWINYGTGLSTYYREFTELVTYTPANSSGLTAEAPVWGTSASGGSNGVIKDTLPALQMDSLAQHALNNEGRLAYERSVYAAYQTPINLDADFDAVAAGLELQLEGDLERGAEVVNERGLISNHRRMALEIYPALSSASFPQESILAKEYGWSKNAAQPITDALNRFATTVVNGTRTVIQAGTHAVLQFGSEVAGGAQVVTSWIENGYGSGGPHFARGSGPHGFGPKDVSPVLNMSYGISGIYRFESTNSLNGPATLTIAYTDAEVSGLNPADLRIYTLPDGTNRWALVGGVVSLASNTVSTTISNLGTFAIAPPLPTGDLQLVAATNTLVADGVSQLTIRVANLRLNTGNSATQQWAFTATASGIDILNQDVDRYTPGVQVYSTNGAITLTLRAPKGGNVAYVGLASRVGDASGTIAINLIDNSAPATPGGLNAAAGQSRVWVSWHVNGESDLAGYRLYYRAGSAGPPWDGTASVEGAASPVFLTGTNFLLRGLALGTNYFVSVSAVDTTGNESPLAPAVQAITVQTAPLPPTGVTARFGQEGTNLVMWALSEDDEYNDRDVLRYDVLRAVLPDGSYMKVGEVPAGIGLFTEPNVVASPPQYLQYAVVAVASNSMSSAQVSANRLMANGVTVDNDGDGIPDWWMLKYFGHATGSPTDNSLAQSDPAGDGLSNLQKYLMGRNPSIWDNLHFVGAQPLADGKFKLSFFGQVGHNYMLEASTNLVDWMQVLNLSCTNAPMDIVDPSASNFGSRFYRLTRPTSVPGLRLAFTSARPLGTNGLELMLLSTPGFNYRIETSSDLVNWLSITNFIATNSVTYFRDPDMTNQSRRFYRAVVP